MTGTFLGTPGYAAPELFADETVGEPADVHAWAATVAFAATGRPTFGRGTVESQMYAILNGQADLAGVPAALLPLIRAALHRDPAAGPPPRSSPTGSPALSVRWRRRPEGRRGLRRR